MTSTVTCHSKENISLSNESDRLSCWLIFDEITTIHSNLFQIHRENANLIMGICTTSIINQCNHWQVIDKLFVHSLFVNWLISGKISWFKPLEHYQITRLRMFMIFQLHNCLPCRCILISKQGKHRPIFWSNIIHWYIWSNLFCSDMVSLLVLYRVIFKSTLLFLGSRLCNSWSYWPGQLFSGSGQTHTGRVWGPVQTTVSAAQARLLCKAIDSITIRRNCTLFERI